MIYYQKRGLFEMRIRTTLIILMTVPLLCLAMTSCSGKSDSNMQNSTTSPKEPEFDFRTTDLNGNEVKLSDFSDAKIIIINMWEPWCGPCVNEMPELEKLYENYKDKGVVIIGVTSSSTSAEAAEVVKGLNIKYPVIINGSDFDIMQTGYVPTTIVVDSEGSILTPEPIIGSKSYEGWESVINTYLKSV